MKLNSDCIRDILLMVEETTDFNHTVTYNKGDKFHKKLAKYTHEEIIYHIHQCDLSELISDVVYYDDGDSIDIADLSPHGHEFLENIRKDNIWSHVKTIGAKIGATSLSALIQISSNVISEIIKAQLAAGGLLPKITS